MSGRTDIEWCDAVWNPITGCTPAGEGCRNCYAAAMAKRFWGERPFSDVRCHEDRLSIPLRLRTPRTVFVNSMGDLFHERVPLDFVGRVFDVMASATTTCRKHRLTDHLPECWDGEAHHFVVLTKRPERMRELVTQVPEWARVNLRPDAPLCLSLDVGFWPLPNVTLGISCSTQADLDRGLTDLQDTPAAKRIISFEPLTEKVNAEEAFWGAHISKHAYAVDEINGIIIGPETGPHRRLCDPAWMHSLADQATEAGVKVFIKAVPVDKCDSCEVAHPCSNRDFLEQPCFPNRRISKDPAEWPEWACRRELP
jgi:protein gp37